MEATCLEPKLSFEDAVLAAKDEYEKMKPPFGRVDFVAERREGVYPLELSEVGANVLEQ